jgi:hypothetical protein
VVDPYAAKGVCANSYVHAVCIEADFTDLCWLLTLLVDGSTSTFDGMDR